MSDQGNRENSENPAQGKRQQIMTSAWVEVVKMTLQIGIARVEAAKLALKIGFTQKFGHRILLILWFGSSAGGII